MTLPNNYILSNLTVIISGEEIGIRPKWPYEIRYDSLYLTRKLTTSKNILIISSTKKYKLKGKIEIEKTGEIEKIDEDKYEEIEIEVEKIGEIEIDKLPRIGEENKPKFDKEKNLIDGGVEGNFIYDDKIYIRIDNTNKLDESIKEVYTIKYIDELIVRKVLPNNQGKITISSTKKFPHNENTIIYLGKNKHYLAISSLPKIYII